jgi:hypothetical protein
VLRIIFLNTLLALNIWRGTKFVSCPIKTMKKASALFLVLLLSQILSSCEIVGGIFKAGMYWGIFLVVIVVVGIIYLVTRGRK